MTEAESIYIKHYEAAIAGLENLLPAHDRHGAPQGDVEYYLERFQSAHLALGQARERTPVTMDVAEKARRLVADFDRDTSADPGGSVIDAVRRLTEGWEAMHGPGGPTTRGGWGSTEILGRWPVSGRHAKESREQGGDTPQNPANGEGAATRGGEFAAGLDPVVPRRTR